MRPVCPLPSFAASPCPCSYIAVWYVQRVVAPFDVLAEPTRRRILDLLLERPRLVGELTDRLGPEPAGHLQAPAGAARGRAWCGSGRDAQRRWYELRPEPLLEIDAWLRPTGGCGATASTPSNATSTPCRSPDQNPRSERHEREPTPSQTVGGRCRPPLGAAARRTRRRRSGGPSPSPAQLAIGSRPRSRSTSGPAASCASSSADDEGPGPWTARSPTWTRRGSSPSPGATTTCASS